MLHCSVVTRDSLLIQLQHHIRDLHVLPTLIIAGDLEDDILLVLWDLLLADGLYEL
jgi:hypothetical protein